jgi:hypothetical protein
VAGVFPSTAPALGRFSTRCGGDPPLSAGHAAVGGGLTAHLGARPAYGGWKSPPRHYPWSGGISVVVRGRSTTVVVGDGLMR